MAYERINWQNGEAGNTPLNANNLNRMDMTLEEHDQKIGDHDYEIENLKTGEQGITEEINKKMDRINPQGSGTLSIPAVNADNITAQTVEADEIKVTKVGSKDGTAPVVFDNDILVSGITTPIGSLASSANSKAESASGRAEDAYNLASRANREAASAINLANDNKVKIDLHTGLIGEGVGDKWPILGYLDGYYIAPNGSVTQYNATATLIKIDFLDFLFRGDNIIFNHVDLLPTENCIPCAWYDVSGNFISAADGLNIIAEFDEQTFKITKQYIDYCIIPVPAGASSCKLSGLANGRADIRIQTSLSEAIKDLQSKPEPVPLVLTNPSPLPCTDGKKILGIDALGKSWQGTNHFEQGGIGHTLSADYASNKVAGTARVRAAELIPATSGQTYNITCNSGYMVIVQSFNESKLLVDTIGSNAWNNPLTVTASEYMGIAIRKSDNSNISVTEAINANIKINDTAIFAPSPSNPIPITDANPEVIAIGKNLFDGENITSGKYIGDDGSIGNDNPSGYTDLITVTPNTTYTFSALSGGGGRKRIHAYDSNGNWIRLLGSVLAPSRGTAMSLTVTTPSNAKYIRLSYSYNNAYEGGANNDKNVQIEVGATVSAYETYQSNSASLPFDPESAGSAANELIVYEDGTGKIIKRIGTYTFSGNEQFSHTESWGFRHAFTLSELGSKIKPIATNDSYGNLMHPNFYISTRNATQVKADEGMMAQNTANQIFFCTNAYSDAKDFADAIKGTTLIYEMRTPIEIPLTAEEVAAVRQLMTYKGTTAIESEMDVVSVTYSGDIKAYIDYRIDQIINPTALNEVAPMNLDETEE